MPRAACLLTVICGSFSYLTQRLLKRSTSRLALALSTTGPAHLAAEYFARAASRAHQQPRRDQCSSGEQLGNRARGQQIARTP